MRNLNNPEDRAYTIAAVARGEANEPREGGFATRNIRRPDDLPPGQRVDEGHDRPWRNDPQRGCTHCNGALEPESGECASGACNADQMERGKEDQEQKEFERRHIRCRKCREPRTHRDCLYCGLGGPGTHVCGRCREDGVDGPVIRGTERRRCAEHRKETTR